MSINRTSYIELQQIQTDDEREVSVRSARFSFADLVQLCRQSGPSQLAMNDPQIIDSKLNHTLDGTVHQMSVVVFPFQYTVDVMSLIDTHCREEDRAIILCGNQKRADKTTRERVLAHRMVFVSSEHVGVLQRILQQKVEAKDNPLYQIMCAQMKGEPVSESDRDCLARLVSHCGSIKELSRVLKPKRGSVKGHIPSRVVYICPQQIGNRYIHACNYDSVYMHSNTSLRSSQFKPDGAVIQDCQKNKRSLEYDERVYPIFSSDAVVQGRPHPFMTVSLPKVTITRITECLKRQNAVFCPISKIPSVLQKETDRSRLLQMHMVMLETQVLAVVPEQRAAGERAVKCLDEPCPICFGNYFQDEASSGFYPMFMRCCLKTICYRCLIRYIKSQEHQMLCPLCRADIEVDVTRRAPIIPIPDECPQRLRELIGSFQHKPRLTEAVVQSISQLMSQGVSRIAILPDSPGLKDDIEHALEFLATMHAIQTVPSVLQAFEQGFSVPLPDLNGLMCFNDFGLLSKWQRFVYVSGQTGVSNLDAKYIDGYVVFTHRELERVVGMTTNTLFGNARDISNRIVLIRQSMEPGRIYEVESGV